MPLIVAVVACKDDPKPVAPVVTDDPAPVDSGEWTIALPTDETAFDDPRRGAETGLPPPETGDADDPELYLRHGGFAWSLLDVMRGHVKLTTGDFTCAELFDPGSPLAEGIHADIDPLHDDAALPIWVDDYHPGTDRPALTNPIVQFAGTGTPAPDDAVLTVHAFTERTVTISYASSALSSDPIVLWNCGERGPWGE